MNLQPHSDLQTRLSEIYSRIHSACAVNSRLPSEIKFVAVSKGHDSHRIREAYALGLRDFGENYVQEWQKKHKELEDLTDIRWHFLGPLQSNKIKIATQGVHFIHSVDSLKTAKIIDRECLSLDSNLPKLKILLQIQMVDNDPNKHGIKKETSSELCDYVAGLKNFEWAGFMGIAPAHRTKEELMAIYSSFVIHALSLWKKYSPHKNTSPIMSLGMSEDLEIAIAGRSNLVRIGTALFGERKQFN